MAFIFTLQVYESHGGGSAYCGNSLIVFRLGLIFRAPEGGDDHGHLLAISFILSAVHCNQVTLLELDRDEYVRGCHDREEQMRRGHYRRAPERQQPSDIKRMPNVAIEERN